jgi:hypothetical protein
MAQVTPASACEVVMLCNADMLAWSFQVHYLAELGPSTQRLKHLNTMQKVNEREGLMDSLYDKT